MWYDLQTMSAPCLLECAQVTDYAMTLFKLLFHHYYLQVLHETGRYMAEGTARRQVINLSDLQPLALSTVLNMVCFACLIWSVDNHLNQINQATSSHAHNSLGKS